MIDANLKIIDDPYENENAVDNTISYIYRLKNKKPLPIYCYGVDFPPTYKNLVKSFYKTRDRCLMPPDQQLYHIILSFAFMIPNINLMHIADDIAKVFDGYPVCYSFHTDTDHPHFHFIVSTSSYFPDYPSLEMGVLSKYIEQAQQMVLEKYNVVLNLK